MPSPVHIRGTVAAIVDQPDDLRELRTFHKALADVNRLRIVRRLADGPATVGELIDTVGLSQPLVSWHVGRLKAAGVIETQRTGREVSCRLRPNVFDEVEGRERILLGVPGLGLVAGAGPTAGASSIAAVSAVGQPGQPAPPPAPRPAEAR
ncbi:MAG: metalloregulator ArsR/SmtB family transcription factor [Candidatus Limnocylindrales bacterium]